MGLIFVVCLFILVKYYEKKFSLVECLIIQNKLYINQVLVQYFIFYYFYFLFYLKKGGFWRGKQNFLIGGYLLR